MRWRKLICVVRARPNFVESGTFLEAPSLRRTMVEPLGYLDFFCLMSKRSVVFTDSGGVQKKTTALGVPCLTLRERPLSTEQCTNLMSGTRRSTIPATWNEMRNRAKASRVSPLWDGAVTAELLATRQEQLDLQPGQVARW